MKTMRKIFALALAVMMVMSLAATAFAAEDGENADPTKKTYSITITNDVTGHIYEAYQIFTGDLHEGILSNVQWGASVTNAEALPDASTIAERMDTTYTGEDKMSVADLLKLITLGEEVATSEDTANPYVISGLDAGYYLVKDVYGSLAGKDDSYTEYIVKVVKDVTANPKSDVPEVQKKVQDINDTEDAVIDDNTWQDSADHDIGDSVPFQLKATLANNVESYKGAYMIVFHDTLSKGLDYEEITKVTVDGTVITEGYDVNVQKNDDGTTSLTITFPDVTDQGAGNSSVVIVEYTAELNEQAEVGAPGNPNVVYLEYSNNPNWVPSTSDEPDEPGKPEETEPSEPDEPNPSEPSEPEEPETPPTGETPDDKVIVFTYKVNVNKVTKNEANENVPLEGAKFTLEKFENGKWIEIELTVSENVFSAVGLDDGLYRITEDKAPAGYNKLTAPIYFKVEATHTVEAKEPALETLTVTLVDEDGNEIQTDLESGDLGTFTVSDDKGTISTDVVNKAGATLPETGGMGTAAFHVVGGFLVVVAVVLLTVKRRLYMAE